MIKEEDILIRSILGIEEKTANGLVAPNARLYIRVSTNKQASEGWSLETQKDRLIAHCKTKGFQVAKIYSDEGISAKAYSNRPELNQLLEDLKLGEFVISVSLSRISRTHTHFLEILKKIEDKGAKLILLDYDIDSSTANGRMMLNMMALLAQHERELIQERVAVTMKNMRQKGELRTKPRYGFRVENGQMMEDEGEQKIIKLINIYHKNGKNYTEIANELNGKGIKLRKAQKIYPITISRIIKDNNTT
jgi:site-specific DNA recombinase